MFQHWATEWKQIKENTLFVGSEKHQTSQVRRISSHGSEFMFKWQASAEQSFCQSNF